MVNLPCTQIQCDEIWAFCGAKEKNTSAAKKADGWGDVWTFVAIDPDTKLIPCWLVGERRIQEYNEQEYIKARCPTGKSFREWVLIDLRGGDNRIHIITAEIK